MSDKETRAAPGLKPIGLLYSIVLFTIPAIDFYVIVRILVPYLAQLTKINPLIVWLGTGTLFLFMPLFVLTFILLRIDGYTLNWPTVKNRLRLKAIEIKDLYWIFGGLLVCTALCALMIVIWWMLPLSFNPEDLKNLSPIKVTPLHGKELWAFAPLIVFYFFNYFGEELLWRGYILPRQELSLGKAAWVVNAILHMIFHSFFGLKALVPFIPFLLLLAFVAYKRKNTVDSIIIHALLGAPIQVMVLLGIIS